MTVFLTIEPGNDLILTMGQPKRKQSKQRSRKRRGANRFKAPLLVKEPDGSFSRPHRVNPETGEYRGRQVLDLEV
jgi:large subunit ribosomal protein L32